MSQVKCPNCNENVYDKNSHLRLDINKDKNTQRFYYLCYKKNEGE